MEYNEKEILEKINNRKKIKAEEDWLSNIYSLNLSTSIRESIAEQLGLLAEKGWLKIQILIKKYGPQPELIKAAGISHQKEAKKLLLDLLYDQKKFNLIVLQALGCWGESLPIGLITEIIKDSNQEIRLAGLELLSFKAKELNDNELISITKVMLNDINEQIVIKTIKILQRRDSLEICKLLADVAKNGSDKASYNAIIGLGSIGTEASSYTLSELCKQLPPGKHYDLAIKQIKSQFRGYK